MDKYSNIYIGLVVNNSDPKQRGRVQVFIPHITNTLYKGWNDTSIDKKFRTLDSANFPFEIVQKLVDILPWAEVSMPFFGGGTGAPVDSSTNNPKPTPTDPNDVKGNPNDVTEIGGYAATSTSKPVEHPKQDGINNTAGLLRNASTSNKVNEQELYNTMYNQLKTKLAGTPIPKSIEQYGVSSNLEGLTLLMMKVANKESSFISTTKGDEGKFQQTSVTNQKIEGGSWGLFQLSPQDGDTYAYLGFKGAGEAIQGKKNPTFTVEQLKDPYFNMDVTTSIWADYIKKGNISKLQEYGWLQTKDEGKLAEYKKSFSPGDKLLSSDYKPDNNILARTTNSFQNVKTGTNSTGVAGGPIGISSIPQIGSKAYVMFLDGNPLQPIVVGCYKEPTNA